MLLLTYERRATPLLVLGEFQLPASQRQLLRPLLRFLVLRRSWLGQEKFERLVSFKWVIEKLTDNYLEVERSGVVTALLTERGRYWKNHIQNDISQSLIMIFSL